MADDIAASPSSHDVIQMENSQGAGLRQEWDRVRIACAQWAQSRRQWEKQDAAGLVLANAFLNRGISQR